MTEPTGTQLVHTRLDNTAEITPCGISFEQNPLMLLSFNPDTITCMKCCSAAVELSNSIKKEFPDLINHPPHYAPLPNGIRPIDVTQFYNFNLGNALKYIMRAGKKTEDPVQDLQKAQKYLEFELERIKQHGSQS